MTASPDAQTTPKQRFGPVAVLVGLVVIVFFLPFPTCPTKILMGAPCPGCGLTRATLALLTFDFAEAARLHPLVFVVPPLVGWAVLRPVLAAFDVIPDDFRPLRRLPGWGWALIAAAMFLLWGLRLAGFLGGHPDPVDLSVGVLSRHLLF